MKPYRKKIEIWSYSVITVADHDEDGEPVSGVVLTAHDADNESDEKDGSWYSPECIYLWQGDIPKLIAALKEFEPKDGGDQ